MRRSSLPRASRFGQVFDWTRRRRGFVLALLLALAAAAGVSLATADFDTSIEAMLPEDADVIRSMRFLRNSSLAGNVVVSLTRDPARVEPAEFHAAIDRFAESLGPPLVDRVAAGMSGVDMAKGLGSIVDRLPEVSTEADLAAIDAKLTPEAVDEALRARYRLLLRPEGAFVSPLVRSDPLNLAGDLLKETAGLAAAIGYAVEFEGGHLVSPDRTHALVVVETPVAMTDSRGSAELLAYLGERTAALPPGMTADVVSGHAHTVDNERLLRRDIGITMTLAAVGFIALFLFWFRDLRAIAVFLIPTVAVVVSMGVVVLVVGDASAFVVGLAGVVAGISVDYGIHTYVVARRSSDAGPAIASVARPVSMGALTTVGVFLAFVFSSSPGYRQLALFAIPSIGVSLACALFVLPHWIPARLGASAADETASGAAGTTSRRRDLVLGAAAAALVAGGALLSCRSTFDGDLVALDGTSADVLAAEARFTSDWRPSGGDVAMLVVERDEEQAALDDGRRAGRALAASLGAAGVVPTPNLWSSPRRRAEGVARWNAFWADGRAARVRAALAEEAPKYEFADDAFDPFLASLRVDAAAPGAAAADDPLFGRLRERFLVRNDDRWQAVSTFPDRPEHVAAARELVLDDPDAFIVSRSELAGAISGSVSRDLRLIGLLAGVFVLGTTVAYGRSVALSLVMLFPTLAACAAIAGIAAAIGRPLNVANVVAAIVVLGLSIDYGIFMAQDDATRSRATLVGVTLSAVTTLIGSGALLAAQHPALVSIGFTLTAGVGTSYLVAIGAVPSLRRLLVGRAREENA